jgi:polyhydroxyalkanoate synthesis repressor PhaR
MTRPITRYGNRKMYDARTRGYITLAGVAGLVAKGEKVSVRDRDSGADMTAAVLLQAAIEREKARPGTFAAAAVAGMIRSAAKRRGGRR